MIEDEDIKEITNATVKFLDALLTKTLAEKFAKWLWTFYGELKAVGFTEEQALRLCQVPSIAGRK